MAIDLTYPDGTPASHPEGVTGLEVARSIGSRLAQAAVAVRVDGELTDLHRPLPRGGLFEVILDDTEDGRSVLRHSAAHVLAQAVLDLFPGAHYAIGPPIQDGFYYDFDVGRPVTPQDLQLIEERMREIIRADQPFVREELSQAQGLELFASQPYKREILEAMDPHEVSGGDGVSIYRNNYFVDLCRGPHVPSTGRIKAFKLLRSAGAYWRGDERRPQLQRIYGTAWESKQALEQYLHQLEEAERRDHRRLGPELDLFSFPRELGAGLIVWHPKGGVVRRVIEDHSRRLHERFGFDFVFSPHIAKAELWHTSGHLDYYAQNMYPGMETDEGHEYRIKPMNCPFHVLIYKSSSRSYRDLPMRLSELGSVYRYERSGVLHGALRARGFTQDDSHTFCTRDQLGAELDLHLRFVLSWLSDFGFSEFEADLSTRPETFVGEAELWSLAEIALEQALQRAALTYRIAAGEGAFYGPKIDVHVRDAIGRRWQTSTIQLDFGLPANFELEYAGPDNAPGRPVMIHCAKAGSIERFFGVLIEHYAGALPMWLAPVQASVVAVSDRHLPYAGEVTAALREAGLRVELDRSGDTVGEKIRRALTQKHAAVLVVGERDVESRTVGVRKYGEEHERRGVRLAEAVSELVEAAQPPRQA